MGLTIYAEPHITHLKYIGILLDYSLALWNFKIITGRRKHKYA